MPAVLDLPAVPDFAADFEARLNRCEVGAEEACRSLDGRIDRYVTLSRDLRGYINNWAGQIMAGRIEFDAAHEAALKAEVRRVVQAAKPVALDGWAKCSACAPFTDLPGLPALLRHLEDFEGLLRNWVSPRLAVGPAARVVIPEAAAQQMRERLASLPPLPADWRPADPAQRAQFEQHRMG